MGETITDDEKLARLRLIRSRGVGPLTYRQLIERFGTASAAAEALPELAKSAGRRNVVLAPSSAAEEEWARAERMGVGFLTLGEEAYPKALAAIADPPPVLSVRGRTDLLARPGVAIVGARKASAAGLTLARRFAGELAEAGLTVISGMARGIDGAAHIGALSKGTTAVLAGGVDSVYPEEHADLYRRIMEEGTVVSEQPLGLTAKARDFPKRNRIVSGLSLGVLVIEAAERSGTLITARLASEQGREVFAVPGSPLDERSRGANELIRRGAALVQDPGDILAEFEHGRTFLQEEPGDFGRGTDAEAETLGAELLELLSYAPCHRDVLIRETGAAASAVAAALLDLVLAGEAEEVAGGAYVRAASGGGR